MQTNYFKITALFSFVLLLIIIVLSVVIYNHGPRVRFIQFSQDMSTTSLTRGASLKAVFDRPLEQKDFSEYVSITPNVEFEVKTGVQDITITLLDNLNHDSDYTVSIFPEINDQSGKKMQNGYDHTFKTTKPPYMFLERNYGYSKDVVLLDIDADDHIKLGRLGESPNIIFSHPEIRSFVANKDYALIAVKEKTKDELYSIDLKTMNIRNENIVLGGRIHNLTIGQRGKVALFTVQPDFSSVSTDYYEKYANRVVSIDLSNGDVLSLTNQAGEYIKAHEITMDNNGYAALVQDQTQTHYAISPYNDHEPILIGSYTSSYGFNSDSSEIIFRERNKLVKYQISENEIVPLELSEGSFVDTISARNSEVFTSQTNYLSGELKSYINRYSDWAAEPSLVWSSELSGDKTMRSFSENFDSTLLAIQLNPENCNYDDIGTNSQCKTTSTVIYDTEAQQIIEDFAGFNFIWLP